MAQAYKITIHHDDDALAILDKFNAVLRKFGMNMLDVTKDDGETVDGVVTDGFAKSDDKLWGQ
jgi:hypothetical protein